MKKFLQQVSVGTAGIAAAAMARASESADTGVTEMNAGPGTFFALLGGVIAMGAVIFLLLKVMNRKK